MQKVAAFDIDGTVFRSSLIIELTERLIAEGHFPHETRDEYVAARSRWIDREGDYDEYINALVVAFKKSVRGVHYGPVADAAKAVILAQRRRVYRYTRDLIKELKTKGYFLLAISHSPKLIAEPFGRALGFNKIYGMMYEIGPQERFTGKELDKHLIANKATILRRAVEKEGLTLQGSVGVGDTESDISFLELVEEAICFNPNKKLYRFGKRMGWKIVVERKDVIYEL